MKMVIMREDIELQIEKDQAHRQILLEQINHIEHDQNNRVKKSVEGGRMITDYSHLIKD